MTAAVAELVMAGPQDAAVAEASEAGFEHAVTGQRMAERAQLFEYLAWATGPHSVTDEAVREAAWTEYVRAYREGKSY